MRWFPRRPSCHEVRSSSGHGAPLVRPISVMIVISLACPAGVRAADVSSPTATRKGQSDSSAPEKDHADSGMFLIRGRPDAPIVENDRLPLPGLPELKPESVYPPLDYVDFLKDTDVFFLFSQDAFELDLDRAAAEMENFSSQQPRTSLE